MAGVFQSTFTGNSGSKRLNKVLGTLLMSYNSLGAIYGDLATSPLYTISGIYKSPPTEKSLILGGVSCVFWLFTIIVIFKYTLIVLTFGPNNNEGGQIAIYSKIARTLQIGPAGVTIPGSKEAKKFDSEENGHNLLALTRTDTHASGYGKLINTKMKAFLSKFTIGLCFLGCSLVFSDGLLTPTTSVLSAIAGIAVAKPSFTDKVMPISCVVLIFLFLIQRFGSAKLSVVFSPVIFTWLVVIFIDGCVGISKHPDIMKALSPHHAVKFLVNDGGIDALAPIMLSCTGAEAMFADVSHFGPLPVQIALGFFVYPCLMVCYLGQGAYLIDHSEAISNLFYESIPFGGVNSAYYWFVFTVSTLATIIASQSLILGVFSIVKQLIILDCFPRLKLVYTSRKHNGKVYIPSVNFVLMVLVVATTVGFKNSNNVTAAFGLGVSIDFILTSILISICLYYVYRVNLLVVLAYFLPFGVLEICLVIAGLKKVPHGAWFCLMVGFVSFVFISTWRWFRSLKIRNKIDSKRTIDEMFEDRQAKREGDEAMILDLSDKKLDNVDSLSSLVLDDSANIQYGLTQDQSTNEVINFNYNGKTTKVHRIPKVYLVYSHADSTYMNDRSLPRLFDHIVNSFSTIPKIFILVETRVSTFPYVPDEERVKLIKLNDTIPGFYRCIIRSGFIKQTRIDKDLLKEVLLQTFGLDELLQYHGADEPIDMIGNLKVPVVEIFERDSVTSKALEQRFADNTKTLKRALMAPFWYVRENVINYVLAPLDGGINNSSMDYVVDDSLKELTENHELIYVNFRSFV